MSVSPLISAAQALLTNLIPLATEQIEGAVFNIQDDLASLHRRLTMIQALLSDAENSPRMIQSEDLKLWLKNLKLAICDAENVLDEIAYESLRSKLEVQKRDQVSKIFNPLLFRSKIANKVKSTNSLLDRICKKASDTGLSAANQLINAATAVKPRDERLTVPYKDESNFVGRDGDVSTVRDMLLGSGVEDDLSVVAIVGMTGLGKTTLAQLLYIDKDVVSYFDQKMWICVSDNFDVKTLLNEMMQSLPGNKSAATNIEGIVRNLRDKLNGLKYLLVLDDVWNTSTTNWEGMWDCLQEIGGCKGSKIIVTTHSMEVVSTMRTSPSSTHRLSELSYDDSWNMFRNKAFAHGGPRENQALVDIGRRLVAQCKGVPLAINSLGRLLYSKQDHREWELIEKTEIWKSLENEDGILPTLRQIYNHLPTPCLKQCFAYCSFFPKDFEIQKDALIWQWMSLGYLQSSLGGNLEMEDVGDEYFNILLRNSLLQDVKLDEYNDITSCKMHDFVHDLALDVAEGSCLTLKAGEVKDLSEVQHLTLHLGEETRLDISKEKVGNLRTLFLTGHLPRKTKFVKCVRVLRLVGNHVKVLPISVRKFIHLRYLDLSNTKIEKLPNFVTSLYNLETLSLPSSLQELPKEILKLVSLRHLCMDESKISSKVIPPMIGHLTSLQTLTFFVVGEDMGHKIEELGSLKHLRGKLRVNNLMFVNDMEEAKKADITGKKGMQELAFHFGLERSHTNHADVLEGLQPHRNLKGLILEEFGGRKFASWMTNANPQFLQNLVKIELRSCRVCEQVPTLGHLPHLEVIEMEGLDELKRIGPEFYGLDEGIVDCSSSSSGAARSGVVFPALRKLSLHDMRKLEEWSDVSSLPAASTSEIKFFPCLKELLISNCPQLVTIPGQLLSVQSISIFQDPISHCSVVRMMDGSSLLIGVNQNSENIALFYEDLFGKSSRTIRNLKIEGLKELRYLPNQLQNLPLLEKLEINHCHNLMGPIDETDAAFNSLTSLQQLSIKRCPKLTCLPKWLLQPTLVDISLFLCPNLKAPNPDASRSLTSLKKMEVIGCPKLGSCWEEGLFCTTSLQSLRIGRFTSWFDENYSGRLPWPSTSAASTQWCNFTSLESLVLDGWPKTKSLPDQLVHLTALRDLEIMDFSGLESLPEWLERLSLRSLNIYRCGIGTVLEKRCKEGSGEDWHKIAHIPSVKISSWQIE